MGKVYYSSFNSSLLGRVFVATTEKGVLTIDFLTTENDFLKRLKEFVHGDVVKNIKKNKGIIHQLKGYLNGKLRSFDCKLDLRGTKFQKRVWLELRKIPYGEVRSYKDIAEAIGHPKAFRAVGGANGQNPIPLIIPCHRVIRSNGDLGGFGHGKEIKKRLIELERAHVF